MFSKIAGFFSGGEQTSKGAQVCEETLCKVSDIEPNSAKEVMLQDQKTKLIVYEHKGEYSVTSAFCTHYGAPLSKGCYSNGKIRCPWHGACFDAISGDIEDSPGCDSLATFQVLVKDGNIVIRYDEDKAPANLKRRVKTTCPVSTTKAGNDDRTMVIIGAGAAGARAAEVLRQEGFTGRVVLIGDEAGLPYDRAKLSKAMSGSVTDLQLRNKAYYEEANIELNMNCKVSHINISDKAVHCSNGKVFSYTRLLVATGGTPRKLNLPGVDAQQIFYLRCHGSANRIWENSEGKDIVIIGGGFIGMEAAATLVKRAKSVTLLSREMLPMRRIFGEPISQELSKLHLEKGVHIEGNATAVSIDSSSLTYTDANGQQKSCSCNMVICGIGVEPATTFLKDSGIKLLDNGYIRVNSRLQTSDPNVFAAGDVACFPCGISGVAEGQDCNIQHWGYAQSQGAYAARSMLKSSTSVDNGQSCSNKDCFRSVPFFWSVQYGKSVRFCGLTAVVGFDNTRTIRDPDEPLKLATLFFKNQRLIGAASLNLDPICAEVANIVHDCLTVKEDDLGNDFHYASGSLLSLARPGSC